ncbi:MAG: alpha/beta fold hydrolase [Pirellulaceae bacterium]|nr:alpha/beta fold hydrolase [Pirellulaceae bacterium]
MRSHCVLSIQSAKCLVWFCVLTLAASSIGQAQEERYELGKRLRRFELAWQVADRDGRVRCVAPMQEAVQSFFGLRLSAAAKELDQAFFVVRSAAPPSDFERYAISRRLNFGPSVVEASQRSLKFKLQPFYKVDQPPPANAQVHVEFCSADGTQVTEADFSLDALKQEVECDISQLSEGDFSITATATSDSEKIPFAQATLTKVRDIHSRLEKVEELLKQRNSNESSVIKSTDLLTCKQIVRTLKSQVDGQIQEIDYPALRLLKMCEALLVEEVDSVKLFRQQTQQDDVWMTLSDTKKQVAVRVRCPQNITKPMPVLFALHGAGGSENMFFETYGAGRIVDLATQRGWMVVAPRQGLLGLNLSCRGMLDVLSQYYEVDPKQVYLVGHSMGAAQVMRQVAIDAELPKAAVAIGGGGRMADAEKYTGFPWLVAAGESDFGRGGARALADSLKRASAKVRYSEYPEVEHMVIVQAALDEVFKFLDEASGHSR